MKIEGRVAFFARTGEEKTHIVSVRTGVKTFFDLYTTAPDLASLGLKKDQAVKVEYTNPRDWKLI